jgi:hypothetical protein
MAHPSNIGELKDMTNDKASHFYPIAKVMIVDPMEGVINYYIRSFDSDGNSHIEAQGTVDSFPEIDSVCLCAGVLVASVYVDAGFRTREVYEACKKYGWTACKSTSHGPIYLKVNAPTRREFLVDRWEIDGQTTALLFKEEEQLCPACFKGNHVGYIPHVHCTCGNQEKE